MRRDDEDYYLTVMLMILVASIAFFIIMSTGCSTPAFNPNSPIVKVWALRSGQLQRTQSGATLGLAAAEGFMCLDESDFEKLIASCTDRTVQAR